MEIKSCDRELNFEEILNAVDCCPKKLHINEWNGCVYIKPVDLSTRLKIQQIAIKIDKEPELLQEFYWVLIKNSVCNSSGELIFNDSHRTKFFEKCCAAVEKIAEFSMKLSRITKGANEELGKLSN